MWGREMRELGAPARKDPGRGRGRPREGRDPRPRGPGRGEGRYRHPAGRLGCRGPAQGPVGSGSLRTRRRPRPRLHPSPAWAGNPDVLTQDTTRRMVCGCRTRVWGSKAPPALPAPYAPPSIVPAPARCPPLGARRRPVRVRGAPAPSPARGAGAAGVAQRSREGALCAEGVDCVGGPRAPSCAGRVCCRPCGGRAHCYLGDLFGKLGVREGGCGQQMPDVSSGCGSTWPPGPQHSPSESKVPPETVFVFYWLVCWRCLPPVQ